MAEHQLGFFGTFSLKKEELRRILDVAAEDSGLEGSTQDLMAKTNLGNAKVGRVKAWATRTGFLDGKTLSSAGRLIHQRDPYLESPLTDWFMHFYLSFGDQGIKPPPQTPEDWGGWCYFVFSFLPQYPQFTLEELRNHYIKIFEQKGAAASKKVDFIVKAYTEPDALVSCQFLTQKSHQYSKGNSLLPNPYLIGYFLAQLWQRDFSREGSVLTESILTQYMGLAPILGITPEALQTQLNTLEAYGLIEQRRTVPPYQIIARWSDPLTLLEKAYASDS
ncbi:hypothetical protein [Spirulina subsalsa]|uniref:hypothetical protein n=1 Tax=Spirulina subsalsa TaxID=54311 RepID=UPI00030212E9|nr:hypothetical protein [Spirulina subsalsa]